MTTNVTSEGQVAVPKKVRDYLGLKPGMAVTFERLSTGDIVLRPAKMRRARSLFAKLRGRASVKMRTEEIMALTRDA